MTHPARNYKKIEDKIQSECVLWFNKEFAHLRWTGIVHIPNGGQRNKFEAMGGTALGVVAGWPDLQILPGNGKVVYVEMKKPGGKPSAIQVKIHEDLVARGYEVYVCDNFDDFKTLTYKILNS